jgi:hypothetical protein
MIKGSKILVSWEKPVQLYGDDVPLISNLIGVVTFSRGLIIFSREARRRTFNHGDNSFTGGRIKVSREAGQ